MERIDRRVWAATALDGRVEARLMQEVRRPSAEKARGFALAAIREVFEETGLVLGTRMDGSHIPGRDGGVSPPIGERKARPPKPGAVDAAGDEWAKFAGTGVAPDLAAVHFIARAITPPGRPRRFDTRFFAVDADAIVARIDGVVGPDTELVELVWLPIDESQTLDMPGITLAVLEEIKIRIADGFGYDLPVPFYRVQRGKVVRTLLT
jgi:8-oxo-dGTP pyrophosphatase MutT (NUDIX family)